MSAKHRLHITQTSLTGSSDFQSGRSSMKEAGRNGRCETVSNISTMVLRTQIHRQQEAFYPQYLGEIQTDRSHRHLAMTGPNCNSILRLTERMQRIRSAALPPSRMRPAIELVCHTTDRTEGTSWACKMLSAIRRDSHTTGSPAKLLMGELLAR